MLFKQTASLFVLTLLLNANIFAMKPERPAPQPSGINSKSGIHSAPNSASNSPTQPLHTSVRHSFSSDDISSVETKTYWINSRMLEELKKNKKNPYISKLPLYMISVRDGIGFEIIYILKDTFDRIVKKNYDYKTDKNNICIEVASYTKTNLSTKNATESTAGILGILNRNINKSQDESSSTAETTISSSSSITASKDSELPVFVSTHDASTGSTFLSSDKDTFSETTNGTSHSTASSSAVDMLVAALDPSKVSVKEKDSKLPAPLSESTASLLPNPIIGGTDSAVHMTEDSKALEQSTILSSEAMTASHAELCKKAEGLRVSTMFDGLPQHDAEHNGSPMAPPSTPEISGETLTSSEISITEKTPDSKLMIASLNVGLPSSEVSSPSVTSSPTPAIVTPEPAIVRKSSAVKMEIKAPQTPPEGQEEWDSFYSHGRSAFVSESRVEEVFGGEQASDLVADRVVDPVEAEDLALTPAAPVVPAASGCSRNTCADTVNS